MRGLAEIVRLRTADCTEVADYLPWMAGGGDGIADDVVAHVERCLRCQAEVAGYRRIVRDLRAMRDELVTPPPGALAAVLAAVEAAGAVQHPGGAWPMRAAYLGGITVATGAGVLVWMSRRRFGLPAVS
ncbi:MAG: hypothetical protein ACRDYY_03265 [Acidimicrobiales bacterium]